VHHLRLPHRSPHLLHVQHLLLEELLPQLVCLLASGLRLHPRLPLRTPASHLAVSAWQGDCSVEGSTTRTPWKHVRGDSRDHRTDATESLMLTYLQIMKAELEQH
jgi:hypothetical protein